MRRVASLLVVAALAVTLAGCTSPPRPAVATGCAPVKPGAVSNAVRVTGSLGHIPRVAMKAPLATSSRTQRSVIHQGTGIMATAGTLVHVEYAMYNGTTGKELTSTGFEGHTIPFTLDETKYLPGLVRTLRCSTVGSRVVGVIPPADAFHAAGSTALGIGAKDDIVFVADVKKVDPAPRPALSAPSGTPVHPLAGFPEVRVSSKGTPTVRVPSTPQPAKFHLEILLKGSGDIVPKGSNVIVNDQVLLWRTGKVLPGNDTWAAGKTAIYNTDQYFAGFKKAVEGQNVGSRILFVVPPALLYGDKGNLTAGIRGTDDLVFLVDILGIG